MIPTCRVFDWPRHQFIFPKDTVDIEMCPWSKLAEAATAQVRRQRGVFQHRGVGVEHEGTAVNRKLWVLGSLTETDGTT